MSKPLAIGLIIFFILVIAISAIWLVIRPESELLEPERARPRRFPLGLFAPRPKEIPPTEIETPTIPLEKRALTQLSSDPVTGFTVTKTGIRFIEKGTGHVFDIGSQGENRIRISNTTIPKIFDVSWSPDASKAVLKYFEDENVRIISAEFVATSTKGTILPTTMLSNTYAPSRERILYLLPTGSGGARTIAADPDNTNQTEVFVLPFQEFILDWPEKNTISYLSRPSGSTAGFLFMYNLKTGSFNKILGDILGLETRWASTGETIIYSSYNLTSRAPNLFVYDVKDKTSQNLQINTLADKCAFTHTNDSIIYCGVSQDLAPALYPDEWLQGVVSTADNIWKINMESGEKNLLATEKTFDIQHIKFSRDDQFLFFIDKKDGSLWSLKLEIGN